MSNVNELLSFLDKSHSAYHAVSNIKEILANNGYKEVSETKLLEVNKSGKYFTTRNNTSIIAFNIPETISDTYSFNIVASHSDSPTFKIVPNCDIKTNKYVKIAVEGYGGMLCAPFMDRPLSIAGRVTLNTDSGVVTKLVDIDKDLLIIPSVAIHFNREANNGFKYNMAVDMVPLLSTNTDISLAKILAVELDCEVEDILGHDLYLYNRQKATKLGAFDEFIASPKIDNLECAFTSLKAFVEASNNESKVNVYCCFDNEEVGSTTRQGAHSTFLYDTLVKINTAMGYKEATFLTALASSFMVSADNAHATHPNHPELSNALNGPYMNEGIVIKFNAAQSYTTDGLSASIFKKICNSVDVKTQFFTNRADLRGGGTLGNISTTQVSIISVDIGLAQLAMHSSYETAGAADVDYMVNGLTAFYKSQIFVNEDNSITIL